MRRNKDELIRYKDVKETEKFPRTLRAEGEDFCRSASIITRLVFYEWV